MRYVKGSSFKGKLEKYPFLRLSFGFDFPAFLPGESVPMGVGTNGRRYSYVAV